MQVIINLYPFRQTVTADPPPTYEEAVEQTDIGQLQPPCLRLPLLRSKLETVDITISIVGTDS